MSERPEQTSGVELPSSLLVDLKTAADSRGVELHDLVSEWLQDRLIHEQEKQEGLARKVRRS